MFLKQSLEWSPVEEDPLLAEFSFLLEICSAAWGLGAYGFGV